VFGQVEVDISDSERPKVIYSLFHSEQIQKTDGTEKEEEKEKELELKLLAKFESFGDLENFNLIKNPPFELEKLNDEEENENNQHSSNSESYETQGHVLGFQLVFVALLIAFLALCCCMTTSSRRKTISKKDKLKLNINKLTA